MLLQSSGLSARNARYVSTGITAWTTVVTIVMGFVVQRARRRRLMLGGQLAFLLTGVVLTLTLVFRVSQSTCSLSVSVSLCLPLSLSVCLS